MRKCEGERPLGRPRLHGIITLKRDPKETRGCGLN
jgi:hypothetical protein